MCTNMLHLNYYLHWVVLWKWPQFWKIWQCQLQMNVLHVYIHVTFQCTSSTGKFHSVTILQAGKGLPCSFTSWFLVLCCDCWAAERRRRRMIICVLPRRSWWPLSQPHLFSPGGHTLQELRAGCCRAAVHVSPAKSAYSSPRHSTHHTVRKAGETATVSCTPVRYGKSGKTKKKEKKNLSW